jgi:phosphoglycolate phosphatase
VQNPKVILFDLDGTLVDNLEIVVDAYYNFLLDYKLPLKSRDFIATLAGRSTFETGRSLGVPENMLKNVDQYFWDYFGKFVRELKKAPNIFPGVPKLLKKANSNHVRMGICTSNEAKSARILMEKANLSSFFEVFVGSEDPTARKPSAEPIYYALDQMGFDLETIDRQSIWFIGDTKYDVQAAKSAKITSIAIPQDHTRDGVLASSPDLITDSMESLYDYYTQHFP